MDPDHAAPRLKNTLLLTAFPPDPGLDLDLGPPRPVLLGEAPLPLGCGVNDVSESHLSNSSRTNLSICSRLTSSDVPSDCSKKYHRLILGQKRNVAYKT